MRSLRLLALLGPAVLLVPAVACENPSSPSAGGFTFEAGPGFEAGPPAEAGPIPDGGVSDAPDVFVPPAPKGVTVTVIDNLAPKADVRVISQDATGAVISEAKTDALGKVTIPTAPSMVTVLVTTNTTPTPVSYLGVADGDNLVVRIPPAVLPEQSPIGQYAVTFTAGQQGQSPNATVYAGGSNGCSNSTNDTSMMVTVSLFPSCVAAANAVLAVGTNTDFNLDGYAFKTGVLAPASANVPLGVTLSAWKAPGATTITASNTPTGAAQSLAALYMIANGQSFAAAAPSGSLTAGGQTFATATGFADAYQSFVRSIDDVAPTVETSFVRRESTTAPATVTLANFDFATALPYITAAAVDTTTATRPIVTLTSDAPLTGADGGVVLLSWNTATQDVATWTFVVPASAAATFKAPALPADAEAVTFTPLGPVNVDRAAFFEATQLPGYKETKTIPIVPRAAIDLLDPSTPLPVNGTVRLTTWGPRPS